MKDTQYEEGGEAHVILQEVGEIVIIKDDKQEGDDGNKNNKDQGVEEGTFELLGGGV